MITYITGVPGAGKTLNTIKLVNDEWGDSDRPIFYCGINELTLPWTEITYEEVIDWQSLPDSSIVLVDEAYQAFPRRSHTKQVPPHVEALARHRHRGFDFYIITQKHTAVDHGLREYVGRHIHFDRQNGFNSCRRFEWNKAVDPDDYHNKETATVQRISFPKEYYDKYKSAEVHTFQKRIPRKMVYIGVLALVCVALLYRVFTKDYGTVMPENVDINSESSWTNPLVNRAQDGNYLTDAEYYAAQWTPRIKDIPHSAPVYDKITEVKTIPRPQCIHRPKVASCKCYTQQATPLELSDQTCLSIVRNGWFNPFIDENEDTNKGGRKREKALASRAPVDDIEDENTFPVITLQGETRRDRVPL